MILYLYEHGLRTPARVAGLDRIAIEECAAQHGLSCRLVPRLHAIPTNADQPCWVLAHTNEEEITRFWQSLATRPPSRGLLIDLSTQPMNPGVSVQRPQPASTWLHLRGRITEQTSLEWLSHLLTTEFEALLEAAGVPSFGADALPMLFAPHLTPEAMAVTWLRMEQDLTR